MESRKMVQINLGVVAVRSYPMSKKQRQRRRRRAERSYSLSGGADVRRYPSFKVRGSGCALLEQP